MDSNGGSRFLSADEVEQCIRRSGRIFRVLSTGGRIPREIISRYDSETPGSGTLDGFALRPPTIFDKLDDVPFSSRVYAEWVKRGTPSYTGVALPGMTYVEATGTFRLDSLGPGSYPGDYFLDEAGLGRTLDSLAAVALREAVKQHLTEGGDERLHLDPLTGGNKYFCPPHPVDDMAIRGSCTCSPPSRYAFEAASDRLSQFWNEKLTFEDACADVRARISAALGLETPHHVVLHPSGTDSEFTPLLIGASKAKALGCSGIVNIVVGAGEVGSNTPKAAGGRHFSKYMPNGGVESSAELVDDFPEGTKVIELKARQSDGSMVADFDQLVMRTVEQVSSEQERPFFIMHAVDGSKLGSHITSRDLVTSVQSLYGDRVLVVLDACQLRTERDELDWYLSHSAVVLVTASKFYGAPGFCAAALVPDTAAQHLVSGAIVPSGLGDYLTKNEVPSSLAALHSALPAHPRNVGLLLRWTCGVTEMERLARQGQSAREAIRTWVVRGAELVRQKGPRFELLEDNQGQQSSQLGGVNSIISFKLLSEGSRHPLDTASLRRIHQWLTRDVSDMLPSCADKAERRIAAFKCFSGQPVDLGDYAILRLAMSAMLACDVGEDMGRLDSLLDEDSKILDKIAVCLKHYDDLSRM